MGFVTGLVVGSMLSSGHGSSDPSTVVITRDPSHDLITCSASENHPGRCWNYGNRAITKEQFAGDNGYRCLYSVAYAAAEDKYILEVSKKECPKRTE